MMLNASSLLVCLLVFLLDCALSRIPPGAKILSATPELQDELRAAELRAAVARASAAAASKKGSAAESFQPSVSVAHVDTSRQSPHLPTPRRAHVVSNFQSQHVSKTRTDVRPPATNIPSAPLSPDHRQKLEQLHSFAGLQQQQPLPSVHQSHRVFPVVQPQPTPESQAPQPQPALLNPLSVCPDYPFCTDDERGAAFEKFGKQGGVSGQQHHGAGQENRRITNVQHLHSSQVPLNNRPASPVLSFDLAPVLLQHTTPSPLAQELAEHRAREAVVLAQQKFGAHVQLDPQLLKHQIAEQEVLRKQREHSVVHG